jgi:hypothetical protein
MIRLIHVYGSATPATDVCEEGTQLTLSIYLWLYSPLLGLGGFFTFLTYTFSRPLWTGISPSQSRYLHTEQHKRGIKNTDIHALSRIRTHDPSVRAREGNSWLRPLGHCDRQSTNAADRWMQYCQTLVYQTAGDPPLLTKNHFHSSLGSSEHNVSGDATACSKA